MSEEKNKLGYKKSPEDHNLFSPDAVLKKSSSSKSSCPAPVQYAEEHIAFYENVLCNFLWCLSML